VTPIELQNIFAAATSGIVAAGSDLSTPAVQAQAWALALKTLTGCECSVFRDDTRSQFVVRFRDVKAAQAWLKKKSAESSAVRIDWIPIVVPSVLPVMGGALAACFIAGFGAAMITRRK
jgi:uncharacterized membrane protein